MKFTLTPFELFTLQTRLRFPFRYGIASMTEVPQLFMRTAVTANGRTQSGLSAEGLPPKWFTKNPETTFEQDLPEMLDVISHATAAAAAIARTPIGFFDLWRELEREQSSWAATRGIAPLLAHLGVSLVERAVLEGLCRLAGEPLHRLLAGDALGLRLGDVYPELGGVHLRDVVRARPLETCFVRHTLGLSDALTASDIPPEDRVVDGLPQDLEASIRAYGLRYFKVKLSGALDRDVPRLSRLLDLLQREVGDEWWVTLDGNEFFHDVQAFRSVLGSRARGGRAATAVAARGRGRAADPSQQRADCRCGHRAAGVDRAAADDHRRVGRGAWRCRRPRSRPATSGPATRTARASSRAWRTRRCSPTGAAAASRRC